MLAPLKKVFAIQNALTDNRYRSAVQPNTRTESADTQKKPMHNKMHRRY